MAVVGLAEPLKDPRSEGRPFVEYVTLLASDPSSQLRSSHCHSTEMAIQNFIWSQEDPVIWFHVIHSCIRELCSFPSWSTTTMVSLLEAGKPLTSCELIGVLVYAKVALVEVAVMISINLVVQPVTDMYSPPKNNKN